jgi:cytoskeleton protein RodZ
MRPALSFPAPVPQRGVPAGALMLLGIVVLAGAYSGWYYMSERQRTPAETVPPIPDHLLPSTQEKPTPSPQVATILPTASPPAPAAPASTAALPPAAPLPAPALPQVQTPGGPGQTVIQLPAPSQVTQPPAAQPASALAPALPPGTRVVIKASADAWVTVKQKGGAPLYSKLMHAGDSWPVPPEKSDLVMTTGNAGGTALEVDGAPVSSLGPDGLVRHDIPLDPAVLKAGLPPPPSFRAKAKVQDQ